MPARIRLVLAAAAVVCLVLALLWSIRVAADETEGPGGVPLSTAPTAAPDEGGPRLEEPPGALPSADPVTAAAVSVPAPRPREPLYEPASIFVVDLEGQPIAGATVLGREQSPTAEEWTGETDATGHCPLAVPNGDDFWFEVTAPGYVGVRAFHYREREVRVELAAAIDVAGRVLDEATLEPIQGANVRANDPRRRMLGSLVVQTDAGGRFLLRGAPAVGNVNIYAAAPGYAESYSKWDLVDVPAGAELELLVTRQVMLDVVLLDDTGAPLADFDLGFGETNASGWVSLSLEPSNLSEGFLTFGSSGPDFYDVHFLIEETAPSPLEIQIPRPAHVEGFVRDLGGRPVAGALVTFIPTTLAESSFGPSFDVPHGRAHVHWSPAQTETDEHGWYSSPPLAPPMGPFRVRASDAYYPTPAEVVEDVVAGSTARLDLAMEGPGPGPRGTVRGRVLLNGVPVDASVVWTAAGVLGRFQTGGRRWSRSGPAEKGAYEGTLPAGEVDLRAELDDSRLWQTESYLVGARVVVQVGEGRATEHDFELELPMTDVGGRVAAADGGPLRKHPVRIADTEGRFLQQTPTDTDGRWLIQVPDQGWEYLVSSQYGGVSLSLRGVHAGDLHADLTLPELGTLPVRALDSETGAVVHEWELSYRIRGEQGRYCGRKLDISGNPARPGGWVPLELRPGVLELWLDSPELGYQKELVEGVVVGTGENEPLEVRLRRGFEQVFVLAEGCENPRDHQVQLLLLEEELWESVHHGAEIVLGEPTIRYGNDHYVYGHGPHYSGATLESRMLNFDAQRATLTGLSPGRWRFKAPASIKLEPEHVLLPLDGPIEVRWRAAD